MPQTAKGWAGLISLPLFYAASTLGFFGAIAMIGLDSRRAADEP